MEPRREKAIVLRAVLFEERHRVVTALTENLGKIAALARNSVQSRRFGGSLDPFTASEWEITEKAGADLYGLNRADTKRAFEGLRKDFRRLALASAWNELMLKVAPEREAAPELFRLHSNALVALEELADPLPSHAEAALMNAYLAKLLQWSGHQPRALECFGCQKPLVHLADEDSVYGLIAEAAWLCAGCRQVTQGARAEDNAFTNRFLRLRARSLGDFLFALTTPIRGVLEVFRSPIEEQKELFAFLEALLIYHLPGFERTPLKSLRFLDLPSHLAETPPRP